MSVVTGNFWNVSNPLKPWGYFDPDAVLDIPFHWEDWLTDIGDTYASHTITTSDPALLCSQSSQALGVVLARIKKGAGELVVGQKYGLTCHIVTAGGMKEDQTLYFKIREK